VFPAIHIRSASQFNLYTVVRTTQNLESVSTSQLYENLGQQIIDPQKLSGSILTLHKKSNTEFIQKAVQSRINFTIAC
jgi:hypothetical protein